MSTGIESRGSVLRWRVRAALVVAVTVAVLAGCDTSGSSEASPVSSAIVTPRIDVSPDPSGLDELVRITVDGLTPGLPVVITLSSEDGRGRFLRAEATFEADDEGLVDLATATPTAGAYFGVDPMGLFNFMARADDADPGAYFWDVEIQEPRDFIIDVTQGGHRRVR